MQSSGNFIPPRLDHIVVGCPALPEGVRLLARATGVVASAGGAHAGWGTHNALTSLGDGSYVELLAPDPAQPPGLPGARPLIGLDGLSASGWCWASADLYALAQRAALLGLATEGPRPFERRRPDGLCLRWRLLHIRHPVLDGIAPFFIDWGDTPSPGSQPEGGLRLAEIRIAAPQPGLAGELLGGLGIDWPIRQGPSGLRFDLSGPGGRLVC